LIMKSSRENLVNMNFDIKVSILVKAKQASLSTNMTYHKNINKTQK